MMATFLGWHSFTKKARAKLNFLKKISGFWNWFKSLFWFDMTGAVPAKGGINKA
jgi:hypothetical protein